MNNLDFHQYKEVWVFLTSMLPILELRGALPIALANGIPPVQAYIICVIGNILPIPFIIFFIKPLFVRLKKLDKLRHFIMRIEERAFKKSKDVSKYNLVGLCIFVAIPLPGTGAWTGALIAALLDMRVKQSLISIFIGVLIAGLLMLGAYYLVAAGAIAGGSLLAHLLGVK